MPANTGQGDHQLAPDLQNAHPQPKLSTRFPSGSVSVKDQPFLDSRIRQQSQSQLYPFTLTVSNPAAENRQHSNSQIVYLPSAAVIPQTSVQQISSTSPRSDPSRMATALLPQPQHHFATLTGHYSTGLFDPYEGSTTLQWSRWMLTLYRTSEYKYEFSRSDNHTKPTASPVYVTTKVGCSAGFSSPFFKVP